MSSIPQPDEPSHRTGAKRKAATIPVRQVCAVRGGRLYLLSTVIAVESVPYRVERARALGAEAVIHPTDGAALEQVLDLTGGLGVDAALDCSGVPAAERFCIDATRRRGQVTFVGECQQDLAIRVSPDLINKGLTVRGTWHYNLSLFPKIMQIIQQSPVIGDLISHTFPLTQVQEAFELAASHQAAKIVLHPWEERDPQGRGATRAGGHH